MTTPGSARPDLAHGVAERMRAEAPWEVIAERATRFELHFHGNVVELERGPLTVEGYGVRLFRPHDGTLGTGFVASTDLSPAGIQDVVSAAETTARHTEFPARSVDLPSGGGAPPDVPVVDPRLWADPARAVREYTEALLRPFEGRKGVVPSFGSVKATLSELSITNSAGLRVGYPSTRVNLELAVKAFGGPEGPPPGEFWVTESARRLQPESAAPSVDAWCRYAADVRRAVPPPSGEQAVVLPTEVLAGIVPPVVGFRCTGAARLRKIAPEVGSVIAAEAVTIRDEGDYPWSPGASPYDDEGTVRSKHAVIERGKVASLLYDTLYASAFSTHSTGNGIRREWDPGGMLRFSGPLTPWASTLVISPGDGGTLDELAEAAGDGILVTQLGWARPDEISGTFGGEIRIGYRIRGGKLVEPIRGGTVGGVVFAPAGAPSLLADVKAIGSRPTLSEELASPTLLIRPLTVAGE